jgi:hypothetical protein
MGNSNFQQNYKLLNLKFNTHLGNLQLDLIKRKKSSFVKSHEPRAPSIKLLFLG